MYRTISLFALGVLSLAAWCASPVMGQGTGAAQSLSMEDLVPPQKPAETKPLDMSLFKVPENAKTADELLKFVDGLQEKAPEPKNQAEMMQLMEAMTGTFLEVADKVLALKDAKPEQIEKATQLKIVALTAKSRMDPKAVEQLNAFVDGMLKNAKTPKDKIKAYQLKLQTMVSGAQNDPSVLDKVNALADEILKNEDEEVRILGMEVRAQALLSKGQNDPTAFAQLQKFAEETLAANAKSERISDKSREIKLLALLMASQKDESKTKAVDDYFEELFKTKMSTASKTNIYKLRLQTLMDPKSKDPKAMDKALDVAKIVEKEESAELKSLAIAVKTTVLLKKAESDPKQIDAVFKYADEIMAGKPSDEQKEQVIGMKIQAYLLKAKADEKAYDELIAYLDKMLAEKQPAELKSQLAEMKIQLLINQASTKPEKIEAAEKALDQFADLKGLEETMLSSRAVLNVFKIEQIAKTKGKVEALDAVLANVKKLIEKDPSMVSLILQVKDSINKIGEANKSPELFKKVLKDFIDLCNASDKPEMKAAAKPLENLMSLESVKGSAISFEGLLAGAEKDKKFNSSALAGKVYLVDIWSTSNASYFETFEELKNLYEGYKDKGFEIVGLNVDQNPQMIARAVEVFSIKWPVVSEKLTKDAKMALPDYMSPAADGTRILVGKDGKAILVSGDINEIKAKLTELLGAPAPKKEEPKKADTPKDEAK